MKVYGLTNCRTTRKARTWLTAQHIGYDFHDLKKQGITDQKLAEWDDKVGYEVFLNKRSPVWLRLEPTIREQIKTGTAALELLREKPNIIKRAVMDDGDFLYFGFDEAIYTDHFLNK
jgi:Spx/MgsR family transcriptional regulator